MKTPIDSTALKDIEFREEKNLGKLGWMLKLLELKRSRTFCDVIIAKGSSFIYAHSCILAAFSPLMMELLKKFSQNDWSILKPIKINLTFITKCKKNNEMNCFECIEKVVEFFYTGKIILDCFHVSHLINLSKNMELNNLLILCEEFKIRVKSKDDRILSVKDVKNLNESNLEVKNFPTVENCHESEKNIHYNEDRDSILKVKNQDSDFGENVILPKEENKYLAIKLPLKSDGVPKTVDEISKKSNNIKNVECERSGEYHCIKCKLRFNNFKLFEAHKKVFHKRQFICLSCNFTTFKLSYIVFHLINMNHEEDCCSVCLYKAQDTNSLKLHLQDHKNDFPFKCYDCGNLFKARTEWLRHMFCHNVQEKNNSSQVCEVCGFVTLYKSIIERHRLKHCKPNKTYTCPVIPCSFSTYSKYNLKQHMSTHELEKCYSCEICSLKFSLEKNLKRHIQTLHETKTDPYKCCRCNYKNARIDKVKGHCKSFHPADIEALNYVIKQHKDKKCCINNNPKDDPPQNFNEMKKIKVDEFTPVTGKKIEELNVKSSVGFLETECGTVNKKIDLMPTMDPGKEKTFILSETTGEFNIISENEGGSIPVASVTSKNVLTIGNFREGTGSVTLNETTGILTFNNINSESTGAVFLNESTGELSYINLGKESLPMEVEKAEPKYYKEVRTQLNEFTGEIFTVHNENKISDFNEEDVLFDSFDMDIGNEDSCDGFDDLDGLLFDPIDMEGTDQIDLFISNSESHKSVPHLNETTGELSFDCMESQNNSVDIWNTNSAFNEDKAEDPYRLLLNEVTGEFS